MERVDLEKARQIADRLEHTRLIPRDRAEFAALAEVVQSARDTLVALCVEAEFCRALETAIMAMGAGRGTS